jgi:O-antigen/teichoic acid export membrane protein
MTVSSVALKVRQVASMVRLRPFDVSTVDGRANERHRRVILTSLASMLAKVMSIATALISVPLTLHYLGAERYGMWMTMSSLVAMLGFADFGIGNGILNAVAGAHGRDEAAAIREYVSSGLFVLSLIAVAILLLFAGAYHFVPWYKIFNVTSPGARADAAPALAILIACFAAAIPLGVVQRVQMGLQKGFMASLWQCFSSLLGLGGVVLAIYFQAGLVWLVLAFAGAPLIASLFNTIIYFGWLHPAVSPAPVSVSRRATMEIAHMGLLFFVLQIVSALAYTSDNIVIAQILGAKAVAAYAVPQRLFSIIPMVLAMVLAPLWPAYGEATARGDTAWVNHTFKRSFALAVGLATITSAFLVLVGGPLIRLWVNGAVVPSLLLLVGLGAWQVVQAGGNAIAMLLNGTSVIKFQVIIAAATGIAAIIAKIFMVKAIGVSGAVWATTACFMIFSGIPLFFRLRNQFT